MLKQKQQHANHRGIPHASGPGVLQFLMEEHGFSEADLPEIGSSDAVAAFLAGKEELSVDQVRVLAKRFRVSTAAFV